MSAPDPGLALVARHLAGRGGPPLDAYKDRCLRRRLAVRMRACGVDSLVEYAAVLDRSPDETARLLEALTINVTEFFRNPEVWDRLGGLLAPLAAARLGAVRAWSAGCASGEEPWSLALLLAELSRRHSEASPNPPVIDATDIDLPSLERGRAGRYPVRVRRAHALCADLPADGDAVRIPDALRPAVRFTRHDLLREPPPSPPYDLILCRNVIIYFEREAQERLFHVFADGLAPGGFLVLGRVETLLGPARARFTLLQNRERIYQVTR